METYFQHYVLNGGWAMLLLIPASVVTLAAILRGFILLYGRGACNEAVANIQERLSTIAGHGTKPTTEDVRAEVAGETLELYSAIQPLATMYVLTPLIGLLGSVTQVMNANVTLKSGTSAEKVGAALEAALVPTMWGLGIAVVAYAGFALLRSRLFRCERTNIMPRAEAIALDLNQPRIRRASDHHDKQEPSE